MTPASIATPLSAPRPRIRPGVCRVCGCTDAEGCVLAWETVYVDAFAARDGEQGRQVPAATCSWVDRDLCSRCHGPRHPTRAQGFELERIRTFKGEISVRSGHLAGELLVELVSQGLIGNPATLTLSPQGVVVETERPPPAPEPVDDDALWSDTSYEENA